MQTKTIDFSKYSSFKIGPKIDVKVLDKDDDFEYAFPTSNILEKEKPILIGSCNNVLIGNNPPPLYVLSKRYDFIKIEKDILNIGGATPSGKIASFCKKNNIANFEFISNLPGTLGGLVYMNAGLKKYEIFNNLVSISTTKGKILKKNINFGYRFTNIKDPILEASFDINFGFDLDKVNMFKKMRLNQPSIPSAGSCFKNPKDDYAGRLIEEVGLKGIIHGDMCFSPVHANFLVNNGFGKFEDAIYLIKEAQQRVYKRFNICLECEIDILDIKYLSKDSTLLK